MSSELFSISFDCANAGGLAHFWSEVLGRDVDPGHNEDFAAIGLALGGRGTVCWMFHKVPEAKSVKNRAHVDLVALDLGAEKSRLVDLGATVLAEVSEGGFTWVTFGDPEGNEFDVIAA